MERINCNQDIKVEMRALQDTLYVLGGKWKIPIVTAIFRGNTRFSDIERAIPGLTKRMLSKLLKELELNRLIIRSVYNAMPARIDYQLTEYCLSFCPVVSEMVKWGVEHRRQLKIENGCNEGGQVLKDMRCVSS